MKHKFKRSAKGPYHRKGRVEIVSKKCAFAFKSLPPIEDVKSNHIKQDARAKVTKEQVTSLVTKQSEREVIEAESDKKAVSQIEADKVCPWARFRHYPNSNQPNNEKRCAVSWCAKRCAGNWYAIKFAPKTRAYCRGND